MKSLVIALIVVSGVQAFANPRQCNPAKSKPCGKSCIRLDYTCHKDVTTAIVGVRNTQLPVPKK